MAHPNPAADLAAKIASLSPIATVTWVVGTNVFIGPVLAVRSEVPPKAIFVMNEKGPPPVPYMGRDEDFARFVVTITVRSEPAQYEDGDTLARALNAALQREPPSGYVAQLSQQSLPMYLGEDELRQHRWSLVFELWWKGAP